MLLARSEPQGKQRQRRGNPAASARAVQSLTLRMMRNWSLLAPHLYRLVRSGELTDPSGRWRRERSPGPAFSPSIKVDGHLFSHLCDALGNGSLLSHCLLFPYLSNGCRVSGASSSDLSRPFFLRAAYSLEQHTACRHAPVFCSITRHAPRALTSGHS